MVDLGAGTGRLLLDLLIERTGFEIIDVTVERQIYAAYTCVKKAG